jgi:fused signal recognition particle receptor
MLDFLREKINSVASIFSKKAEEKLPEAAPEREKPAEETQGHETIKPPIGEMPDLPAEAQPKKENAQSIAAMEQPRQSMPEIHEAAKGTEQRMAPNIGIVGELKGRITGKVTLDSRYVDEAMDSLEMSMLEADVAFEVAEQIKERFRKDLEGREVPMASIGTFIKDSIRDSLGSMMLDPPDLAETIKGTGKRPYVILLFGLNGSGKTTTLAKLAFMLKNSGLSVIAVAADTFRAASIEQLMHHGEKVGFEVVKSGYGADPTAVTFDGVKHAQAKGIDVVLVDTAGRQNANKNLMKELQKMSRVIKPDLSLFIGESISGNALYDAVREYNEAASIQGVILTKLDLDAKGGSVISVSKALGVPIYYLAYGQRYDEMEKFSKEKILKRLFG